MPAGRIRGRGAALGVLVLVVILAGCRHESAPPPAAFVCPNLRANPAPGGSPLGPPTSGIFVLGGLAGDAPARGAYTPERIVAFYRCLKPDVVGVTVTPTAAAARDFSAAPAGFASHLAPAALADGVPLEGIEWANPAKGAPAEALTALGAAARRDPNLAAEWRYADALAQAFRAYAAEADIVPLNSRLVSTLLAAQSDFQRALFARDETYAAVARHEEEQARQSADLALRLLDEHPGGKVLLYVPFERKPVLEAFLRRAGMRVLDVEEVIVKW